jgi:hypothetical protein
VRAADLNRDDRLDLVVSSRFTNQVIYLLGNGNGTFQSPIGLSVGSQPLDVLVSDFNSDQKPDLLAVNLASNNVTVRLNTTILPLPPQNLSASPPLVCYGQSSTLSADSEPGVTIDWYRDTCLGSPSLGSGNSISVTPYSTIQYFARSRNLTTGCKSPECTMIEVPVFDSGTGDINRDGQVDGIDLGEFIELLLVGEQGTEAACYADLDGSGSVDLGDIDPFVELILSY